MPRIDNNLILVKGEDKTKSISKWRFEKGKPIVWISYGQKEYPYNSADVKFLMNPVVHDLTNKLAFNGESVCNGAIKAQIFGDYCRIVYSTGYTELIKSSALRIVDSALSDKKSNDCFEYFKQLAHEVGLESGTGHNILAARYDKIDFVREDSILAALLKGTIINNRCTESRTVMYPFGFNISQKSAVDNALNHRLSVIEGPPGTGKTQTILNIIANVVMRGESVSVVSSNNSATANVLEKLAKYGVDFIAAYLGNSSNKEAFISNQHENIPDLSKWYMSKDALSKAQESLAKSYEVLEKMLENKNELSKILGEYDSLEKEYKHYIDYDNKGLEAVKIEFGSKLAAERILEFIAEYELLEDSIESIGVFKKIFWMIKYRLRNMKFWGSAVDAVTIACMYEYYERKRSYLKNEIEVLSRTLDSFDFERKMAEYSDLSMCVFKAFLERKYDGLKHRQTYTLDDLWKKSEDFINDYPVILSTTYSLRSSLSSKYAYDYVIVDEASQVDLATGALAFSCAKKAVVVGDLKQLPNVVTLEQREKTSRIFSKYNLPQAYNYYNHSLLSTTTELFADVPKVLLREHYRCHPEIIGFCNQRFYNNELIILTEPKSDRQALLVYRTVEGNHARGHQNQRQIDVIKQEVVPQQQLNVYDNSVGIVTPYRDQANALQKAFDGTTVKADTADKFQGQERSVMIFSTVDNEIGEFVSDPNRLNVAVSRAIDQFIVVTDGNDNDNASPIHELIGYIQYNNHDVIDSKLYSVFDYLYKDYANAREQVLKKYGRINDIESENLMYHVIRDVLVEETFAKYDVVSHVPLKMIINDYEKLNDREKRFIANRLTHVDFLIYSKLTHQPVMVVEVDGFAYHAANEKQLERDAVKDSILEKYSIPIVRFSTVCSGESVKLKQALLNLS